LKEKGKELKNYKKYKYICGLQRTPAGDFKKVITCVVIKCNIT
jgi:hypothetical protein